MRSKALAIRIAREIVRDPLWVGLALGLPVGMLLILQAIPDEWFNPTNLVPGTAVYGFSVLTFSSGMILAKDRETALLSRLLTAPLRPIDFILAYSLPFVLVAIIQVIILFAIGGLLGLEQAGNIGYVALILLLISVCLIGLGMVMGSLFNSTQVGVMFAPLSVIVAFSGAWFDLEAMGGVIEGTMSYLPFSHALDAIRTVMVLGAGFSEIATDLYWVVGYTVIIVPLGVFLFKRRMVE